MRPAPEQLAIGTMLEVPALMWQLPELLRDADFISVGSNDLLQFMFAADRGTPSLYGRYDLLSQPVLDLLEQLLAAAKAAKGGAGVPVSLCGEAASRPLEALALVGLGLTSLSMPASGLLAVKALLRGGRSGQVPAGACRDTARFERGVQLARADRRLGARARAARVAKQGQGSAPGPVRGLCPLNPQPPGQAPGGRRRQRLCNPFVGEVGREGGTWTASWSLPERRSSLRQRP